MTNYHFISSSHLTDIHQPQIIATNRYTYRLKFTEHKLKILIISASIFMIPNIQYILKFMLCIMRSSSKVLIKCWLEKGYLAVGVAAEYFPADCRGKKNLQGSWVESLCIMSCTKDMPDRVRRAKRYWGQVERLWATTIYLFIYACNTYSLPLKWNKNRSLLKTLYTQMY